MPPRAFLWVPHLYWGKIIGVLAGLATTKPLLALLGLILGHQFDRGFIERFRQASEQRHTFVGADEAFVSALFRCMGHIAKFDGRVSEDEIRAARSVMHRIGLGPAQVGHAIGWFNEGKEPGFAVDACLSEFRRAAGSRGELRTTFVRLLLEVVFAKPQVSGEERAEVWRVCQRLNISRVELAQLEAMTRAQKGFRRSPAGDVDRGRLRDAYALLGVDATATNDEIKKAYRRLINQTHPDKIASSNPDADALAEAERKTREVRRAYELLKVRRTIR